MLANTLTYYSHNTHTNTLTSLLSQHSQIHWQYYSHNTLTNTLTILLSQHSHKYTDNTTLTSLAHHSHKHSHHTLITLSSHLCHSPPIPTSHQAFGVTPVEGPSQFKPLSNLPHLGTLCCDSREQTLDIWHNLLSIKIMCGTWQCALKLCHEAVCALVLFCLLLLR